MPYVGESRSDFVRGGVGVSAVPAIVAAPEIISGMPTSASTPVKVRIAPTTISRPPST
jgi:hypothetical protein